MTPTDVRAHLAINNYVPIPCVGKAPVLKKWQTRDETSEGDLETWVKLYPDARNTGILCARRRCLIKPPTLHFHGAGLVTYGIETQRPHQPDWLSVYEPFHVLPADKRNVVPEFSLMKVDEPVPVRRFLRAHPVKYRSRRWKILAQALGVIGVHTFVLFFERDRESQDFLL